MDKWGARLDKVYIVLIVGYISKGTTTEEPTTEPIITTSQRTPTTTGISEHHVVLIYNPTFLRKGNLSKKLRKQQTRIFDLREVYDYR